jgi:16S rRNA G1207 methylase RsmC
MSSKNMRPQYPLFQSHLDLSQNFWKKLVQPGDSVIDATCGNGHDSLTLAELALTPLAGALYVFDIQKQALESTKIKLQENLDSERFKRITFYEACHSKIAEIIPKETIKLIVYNLGYLPGGDKSLTTSCETTLKSIQGGLELLQKNGAISITCYPGHPEGAKEEKLLIEFCQSLDPARFNVSFHRFINRKTAPSLLFLQIAN